jgi:hypothetical protein
VAAPAGGDAVGQRQRAVGVGRHVDDREVVVDERRHQAAEGDGDEDELRLRRRPRQLHPGHVVARRADDGQGGQRQRDEQRDHQREQPSSGIMACLGLGQGVPAWAFWRALDRVGGLGRHVVLVVLGQHFLRAEDAVAFELALRDHAFAFLEQVGQDAAVFDRDHLGGVGDREAHRHAVGLALDAAGLDQAAQAEGAVLRRLVLPARRSGCRRTPGCC